MHSLTLYAENSETLAKARALLNNLTGLRFEDEPAEPSVHPVIRQLIQKGVAQLDAGQFYTHEEVLAIIENELTCCIVSLLKDKRLSPRI